MRQVPPGVSETLAYIRDTVLFLFWVAVATGLLVWLMEVLPVTPAQQ